MLDEPIKTHVRAMSIVIKDAWNCPLVSLGPEARIVERDRPKIPMTKKTAQHESLEFVSANTLCEVY